MFVRRSRGAGRLESRALLVLWVEESRHVAEEPRPRRALAAEIPGERFGPAVRWAVVSVGGGRDGDDSHAARRELLHLDDVAEVVAFASVAVIGALCLRGDDEPGLRACKVDAVS